MFTTDVLMVVGRKWSKTLSVKLRNSSHSKTSIRAMAAMAMVLGPSYIDQMSENRRQRLLAAAVFFHNMYGSKHLRKLCDLAHSKNHYRPVSDEEFARFISTMDTIGDVGGGGGGGD